MVLKAADDFFYFSVKFVKKGTTIISEYRYGYDSNQNINSITDASGTTTYTYDKLDRLTEVHRPNGSIAVYSYDLKGNRKTLQDDSTTIDIDNVSYTYDLRDRLTQVTKGTTTTSYSYQPDGLRYKKTTPAKTVQYHYNLAGKVVAESDGTGAITADYIWGPDRTIVNKDTATGNQYYYLYNGHGDVVQIVDASGNIVNSYAYDEWGNIKSQTEGIENSFKYAGEMYDETTGLYYLRARYYDPQTGRFLNEDSFEGQITDPLSFNLYTYCENDPIDNVDPSGHNPVLGALIKAGCKYVIKPAAKYVYKKAIKPAAKFVYNKAIKPSAKYVYNKAIKPAAKKTKEVVKNYVNNKVSKSVDKIIKDSKFIRKTKGNTFMYEKSGGYSKAIKDFKSLKVENVQKLDNGSMAGKLKNGTKVNIHRSSLDGQKRWTLEIGNKKIRYDE